MNLAQTASTVYWLVRDTFRQAVASGISWVLLGVSAVCILTCLSIGINGAATLERATENSEFLPRNDVDVAKAAKSGVDVISGDMTLAFGAFKVPLGRDAKDAVRFIELVLAGGVADTLGLLLALIWTAGFLPSFLDPRSATVLLAKPVPRWGLLVGKYVGVLTFVLFNALIFVLGTWVALGIRTGIWNSAYLLAIPMLLMHFAIFFAFSMLVAVCTRSTVACVFGSIGFWLVCWGMNYGRHAVVGELFHGSGSALSTGFTRLVEAGYWILPKPADMGILLYNSLGAEQSFGQSTAFTAVQKMGAFSPALSILASGLFTLLVLAAALREFATQDY